MLLVMVAAAIDLSLLVDQLVERWEVASLHL